MLPTLFSASTTTKESREPRGNSPASASMFPRERPMRYGPKCSRGWKGCSFWQDEGRRVEYRVAFTVRSSPGLLASI